MHISFLSTRFLFIFLLFISLYSITLQATAVDGPDATGTTLSFRSGPQQNNLIELYTSEGCSSCPPAERFLNQFRDNPQLWNTLVPVAFHVDYWDYIGWQDPYAQAAHGRRQSTYARQKKLTTVYTPAFVVNGQSWRKGLFNHQLPISNNTGGVLKARLDGSQLIVEYQSETSPASLDLNIAVLGMDLESDILAGENSGRQAQHEFVVVGYKVLRSNKPYWKTNLPSRHYKKAKQHALAIWVNRSGNLQPLQATGGYLPSSTYLK